MKHLLGTYAYVTHNLIEAVLSGAVGHVIVEGERDDQLMTQVLAPTDMLRHGYKHKTGHLNGCPVLSAKPDSG